MTIIPEALGDMGQLPSISVITATFNAADCLPRLIQSLEAQTDNDFTWIVADGQSRDDTLLLLDNAEETLNVIIDAQKDCGIYDALNRAIELCTTEFYVIAGADDVFDPNAIANYRREAADSNADLIAARIVANGSIKPLRRPWEWLYGQFAHVSSHAVGLLIRRDLHQISGAYRTDLRIASDQYFILKSIRAGAVTRSCDFIAGDFNTTGASDREVLTSLLEGFSVMISLGHRPIVQLPLLVARLTRHRNRLAGFPLRKHDLQ